MPAASVALVLVPTSEFAIGELGVGAPAWVASTPEMQETLAAAKLSGLEVTELFPNGKSPSHWLKNHLDSVDQHHNEISQTPPYTELLVFGVEYTPELMPFLAQFGFVSARPRPFGFTASKASGGNATLGLQSGA